MEKSKYYVVRHQGEWKIKVDGEHLGSFETQKDAIQIAVETAREIARQGGEAQVLVQGRDSKFRTEWTYGD